MNGKVISLVGNKVKVLVNSDILDCSIKGKIKFENDLRIMIGDNVNVAKINNDYVIQTIYPRQNSLIRPKIANIDCLFIIQSIIQPDFNMKLIMKFLAYYECYLNHVVIYLSKSDLCNADNLAQINKYIEIFSNDSYEIKIIKPNDYKLIKKRWKHKVICFAGNSGVGKSTFINHLFPQLQLKTQGISLALNRGKHTTTTSNIYIIDECYIVDTPGFSSIDINLLTPLQLARSYHDFKKISTNCKYSNCLHLFEDSCAIKEAVMNKIINPERYKYYCELQRELSQKKTSSAYLSNKKFRRYK